MKGDVAVTQSLAVTVIVEDVDEGGEYFENRLCRERSELIDSSITQHILRGGNAYTDK